MLSEVKKRTKLERSYSWRSALINAAVWCSSLMNSSIWEITNSCREIEQLPQISKLANVWMIRLTSICEAFCLRMEEANCHPFPLLKYTRSSKMLNNKAELWLSLTTLFLRMSKNRNSFRYLKHCSISSKNAADSSMAALILKNEKKSANRLLICYSHFWNCRRLRLNRSVIKKMVYKPPSWSRISMKVICFIAFPLTKNSVLDWKNEKPEFPPRSITVGYYLLLKR